MSRREHTASGHIAVAGLIRKRHQRRAHGGGCDRYGTLRLRLPPRFKDAEQERSDELLARFCWHHLFERSGSTVSAPRSVAVVLTRQLLAPGVSGRVTHSTHCVCASLEHDGQTAVRKVSGRLGALRRRTPGHNESHERGCKRVEQWLAPACRIRKVRSPRLTMLSSPQIRHPPRGHDIDGPNPVIGKY